MLLQLFVLSALAVPPAEDDQAAKSFGETLQKMYDTSEQLKDATFTMYSKEWVGGAYTDEAVMEVKFRRPDDCYLEFTGGPNSGRKVLYRGADWNGGKLRVDPGRFIPTMNLDPTGTLAMRGNRHSIKDLPPTLLIEKIVKDALKVNDSPNFTPNVTDLGETTVRGEPSQCWEALLPKDKDPSFYASKVKVCVNPGNMMPNSLRIYDVEDGSLRLIESYDYVNFKVNPKLSDDAFEPETYGL